MAKKNLKKKKIKTSKEFDEIAEITLKRYVPQFVSTILTEKSLLGSIQYGEEEN